MRAQSIHTSILPGWRGIWGMEISGCRENTKEEGQTQTWRVRESFLSKCVYKETWSTGRNQQSNPWGLKRHSWRLEHREQVGIRLKRKSRARSWRTFYTILRSCALSEAVGNHWRALSKGLSAWQLRKITLDIARMRVEKSGQALSFHAGLIFLIF